MNLIFHRYKITHFMILIKIKIILFLMKNNFKKMIFLLINPITILKKIARINLKILIK